MKEIVELRIDEEMIVEACHAPEFSVNIIAMHLLLKASEVEFSENNNGIPTALSP